MTTHISQIFIFIGYLIFILSRFRKKKASILITDNISRMCFIVGYTLFHSINGIEHTVYGIVRNLVAQSLTKKGKRNKNIGFIIMLFLLCLMYGYSFNGFPTVMLILSGIINLYVTIFATEQGIRLGTLFAAIFNIISFTIIGSYASVLGEIICGISGITSFIKEYKCINKNCIE